MNPIYSDIVQPAEMLDARSWLQRLLAALSMRANLAAPEITCLHQGWGTLHRGMSVADLPLCLDGKKYATGLGTHAESAIHVRLPVACRRLRGLCGVSDNPLTREKTQPLVFSVDVGGREIWRSGPQKAETPPARVDVPLAGKREFILRVRGPYEYAHADWVDMKVLLANGKTVDIGEPVFDLGGWRSRSRRCSTKDGYVLHSITLTDPATGLAVACDIREYTRFPVVEWGLRLKNTSKRRSPLIEDIRSLDINVDLGPFPYLNYWNGDYCSEDGYEPFRVSLAHKEEYRFAPMGGRPTNRAWPYYNLEGASDGRGLIVVVGWAGQWASSFRGLDDNRSVHITAGQERTRFKLLPGEEVRTPLSVLMFYRGDKGRSQNLWRRWMLAHNLPRPGGRLPEPILPAYGARGSLGTEMAEETEETQKETIDRYVEEGIGLDYWWMDAGWYPCDGKWANTGTWEPDAKRFPRGLRAVCDHAHAQGMKTLVWFEPERVRPGTWLWDERPQWLLECAGAGDNRMLNLGNPVALKWLTDHVSRTIREQGIDLYRQDFNFEPLPYWRANDARDRQGITEIRYVEGYLAFWKELRRRFPNMLIDSCASGGRRNDLETMRLSVPLHKTDYGYADQTPKQAFHHSLASWLPYYGALLLPRDSVDVYAFRSSLASMTLLVYDLWRRDVDWRPLKRLAGEWRRVTSTGCFYGDYYPLTPYNRDDSRWIAWQFHRPDTGEGLVQAFRRKNSPAKSMLFCLEGLDPLKRYTVTDMDQPEKAVMRDGRDLMESGLLVEMQQAPQARVIVYRSAK
jgi:alpha-galactosidase